MRNSDALFRSAIAKDVESSGKDAKQYLSEVGNKASQYMMEDEICGREIISTCIKHGILNPGNLTFITGGRSVGKSKILKSIVKEIGESQRIPVGEVTKPPKKKVSVVMMDGRNWSDVVYALNKLAIEGATQPLTFYSPIGCAVEYNFNGTDFAHMSVAGAIKDLHYKKPRDTSHSVLILDEANVYFNCSGKEEDAQRTKELYHAAVLYTKQLQLMSVVLVSADERLPCSLRDLRLNPGHITSTWVINEPTPQQRAARLLWRPRVRDVHVSAVFF